MEIKCDCGGVMQRATIDVALKPVFGIPGTAEGYAGLRCKRCGFESLTGQAVKAIETTLVRTLVRSLVRLAAAETKVLRQFLGLTQAELAKRTAVSRKTVALWETRGGISPANDYMLRGLCAAELGTPQALEALRATRLSPALKRPKPITVSVSDAA